MDTAIRRSVESLMTEVVSGRYGCTESVFEKVRKWNQASDGEFAE
ncbi:MAG: hypothetical protein WAU02_04205 [Candidatus Saccharimonadales bacterium]